METYENFIDPKWENLNESQQNEIEEVIVKIKEHASTEKQFLQLDESILGNILGGTIGYLIGPTIGKKIANALGIQSGILFDLMTSKIVNAAIGAAIANR